MLTSLGCPVLLLALLSACTVLQSGVLAAPEGVELLRSVWVLFSLRSVGTMGWYLTHEAAEAFVCILPEHLGTPLREGSKVEKKEETLKIK